MPVKNVLVIGIGKVGRLVATLLKECQFHVKGLDAVAQSHLPFEVIGGNADNPDFLEQTFQEFDTIISCLPYHLNKQVVAIAHKQGLHYFDLTEDVPTTNAIRTLAENSKGIMAPQCGLAPGLIGIVGAHLAQKFEKIRSIELKVGALPRHPSGELGYAFNWSPEGVVNEYLNDCEVIRNGEVKTVPAMQNLEKVVIDGITLEAFTTSGGLGTMCETYAGKVDKLNYKTMRYPGHMRLMRFYFHELLMKEEKEKAGNILVNAKPPVDDDVVYFHAAVEGWRTNPSGHEILERKQYVRAYEPVEIAGEMWRAISWTTACSLVSVVEMVAKGTLPAQGFLKQEEIPFKDYLETRCGQYFKRFN